MAVHLPGLVRLRAQTVSQWEQEGVLLTDLGGFPIALETRGEWSDAKLHDP